MPPQLAEPKVKKKFDFVMGNPPWLSYRYADPAYQDFLKEQITKRHRLLAGRGHLITHMEVATLFLVRAPELYLKRGGTIAFVLPRSVFTADQHDCLRRRAFRFSGETPENVFWSQIWDCEDVRPLFRVPTCVVFGQRRALGPVAFPIPGEILSGTLPGKNCPLSVADAELAAYPAQFSVHSQGNRSYWTTGDAAASKTPRFYRSRFAEGATIVPRSFWFVRVRTSPLGFNPEMPPLETDPRAIAEAKEPYKGIHLTGNVERCFLYSTLISTDLLPFGHTGFRLAVLPIEPNQQHYTMLSPNAVRERGSFHLATWLELVEREWLSRRSDRARGKATGSSGNPTALQWLDYRKKLTDQNPHTRYRAVYAMSATYMCAAVVANQPTTFDVDGQSLTTQGFVTDYKLFAYETNRMDEANYLAALLNSPVVDRLVKPMQSRGLWGPRDICKKVLELPIPEYDAGDPTHARLATLGELAANKVAAWVKAGGCGEIQSIGKLRSMVRIHLAEEVREIDTLACSVLRSK